MTRPGPYGDLAKSFNFFLNFQEGRYFCNSSITLSGPVNELRQSGEVFVLCVVLGFQVEMRML